MMGGGGRDYNDVITKQTIKCSCEMYMRALNLIKVRACVCVCVRRNDHPWKFGGGGGAVINGLVSTSGILNVLEQWGFPVLT